MFAKYALSLLAVALATTSCAATNPTAPRQLPKRTTFVPRQEGPATPTQVAPAPTPRRAQSHVFIKLGRLSMDDTAFWTDVNRPFSFGVEADFREQGTNVGPEFGFALAIDSESLGVFDDTAAFLEFYGGVRITGDFGPKGRLHPYIGGGAVVMVAELERVAGPIETTDDDVTVGGYAHAGVYYSFNRVLSIGIDGRTVFGTEVDLLGARTDADYEQVSFLIGFGF